MMYRATISKDEVNELTNTACFPGEITVVNTLRKVAPAIKYLNSQRVVGFDTETKPSFTRGETNEVSLIQISSLERAFLFRLNIIDFPQKLVDFIKNPEILKIGLSLQDDFRAMRRRTPMEPQGFVDLQKICPAYGIREMSLRSIYAILFDEKISKQARLTNWEREELPEKAIDYAALDAYACLRIYNELLLRPTPEPYRFGLMFLQ